MKRYLEYTFGKAEAVPGYFIPRPIAWMKKQNSDPSAANDYYPLHRYLISWTKFIFPISSAESMKGQIFQI